MTTVQTVTTTPTTTTSNNATGRDATEASSQFNADFQTFLKLLTTQLQYQDPLQPLEATQFVTQLAQFSGVEQQIATNKAMGVLIESIGASGAGALGAWLGKEVRVASDVHYEGGPLDLYPMNGPAAARSATVVIKSFDGSTVARIDFPRGEDKVTWDGKMTDGTQAPKATYSVEVQYETINGEKIVEEVETYALVTEARRAADGTAVLALRGGRIIEAGKVTAMRERQS
ncbi:MAG: flagellar hook capping FlgD N-terminal domain-containing protein [Rubrimonas sp.]